MLLTLLLFSLIDFSSATWYYGVDFSDSTTVTQLKCFLDSSYYSVLPRVFHAGEVDQNGIQTMKTIREEGILINSYGYITPGMEDGEMQINKLYNALVSNGLIGRTFYLKVSLLSPYQFSISFQVTQSSSPWTSNSTFNVNLINSMITRGSQCGLIISIQTTYSDWVAITSNVRALVSHASLWYSNVFGSGVTGESQQNYDDFVAFGPFSKASVVRKQFAVMENVCGLDVNRNVYWVG